MKRILIAAAIFSLIGLLLAAPQLAGAWLDKYLRAGGIELQKSPQVHFFPPSISLNHIRWVGHSAGMQTSFSSHAIHVYPQLGELLKGQLVLQELQLDTPCLQITRPEKEGPDSSKTPHPLPTVERLVCKDGVINLNWDDLSITLDNLHLAAANIRNREEMDIQSDFIVNLSLHGEPRITANGALRTKARYYAPNLTVRNLHATFTPTAPTCLINLSPLALELSGGLDPAARRGRIKSVSLSWPGARFSGSGEFTQNGFEGTLVLTSNIFESYPIEATLKNVLKDSEGQFVIPDINISANTCRGTGTVRINPKPISQPVLNGNFKMGPLQLPSLRTIISQDWLDFGKSCLSKLPKFQFSANFSQIGLGELVLTSPKIQLSGQGSQIHLENFDCGLGRGTLNFKGVAHLDNDQWQISASGSEIKVGETLKAAGIKEIAQGTATFALQMKIASQKGNFIFPQLDGSGHLQISNLEMSILEEIASLIPDLEKLCRKSERIRIGEIGFNAQNGTLAIRPLRLAGPNLNSQGEVLIDLVNQALEGHLFLSLGSQEVHLSFSGTLADPEVSLTSRSFKSSLVN